MNADRPVLLPTKEPASLDELVEFIARSVRDHHNRTGRALPGSVLAYLVRQEYPAIEYSRLGLTRFGDAVRVAADRQLVKRNDTVSHLEVLPVPSQADRVLRDSSSEGPKDLVFVRPDLWRAVVLASPKTMGFFDRSTGEVREIAADAVKSPSDSNSGNLVAIVRVDQAQQLSWLRDFLVSRSKLEGDSEQYLESLLRGGISQFGSVISRDWKYLRSRKVVDLVRNWALANEIKEEAVLIPPSKDAKVKRSSEQEHGDNEAAAVRRAVNAAINDMSLVELEGLSLPLRYILRHFKAK